MHVIYSLVTLMTFTSGLVRFSALSHKLVDVCQTFQALVMMKGFFLGGGSSSHQTMLEKRMLANALAMEATENYIIKIFYILLLTKYNQTALTEPGHKGNLPLAENCYSL